MEPRGAAARAGGRYCPVPGTRLPARRHQRRRALSPVMAVERILRARSALRDGLAVYLTADIPWDGPNSRPGRLLGQTHRFLSVWADLAVQTRVPVFLVFCNHRGGGRYTLTI